MRGVRDSNYEPYLRGLEVGVKALRGVGDNNPLFKYGGSTGGPHRSVRAGRQQL
jgi:hypothetical protein